VRLRTIGVLILLLGLGGAGLVYWTGAPPEDLSDDVATARTSKKEARAIEMNVGKMGLWTNDLLEDLQDPGTQAVMIVVASILVASGCFYFARLQARGNDSDGPVG
jgi:flagellar basal body-associated protein FliL